MVPEELALVERFGGQVPVASLWESMKGFSLVKEILERRVVAPLAHTELADRLGLRPPAAVLLFGPPGTGKTSFARAVASRLSWAFVEMHPSLLGQGVEGARALRDTLTELGTGRPAGVLHRRGRRNRHRPWPSGPTASHLVNELLKAIPMFKSRPDQPDGHGHELDRRHGSGAPSTRAVRSDHSGRSTRRGGAGRAGLGIPPSR